MTPRAVCVFACSLVGITLAGGARPSAQTPAPPQAVFRAAVDHVRVDVVVTDDHDRPVTGLTRDDFEIVEHDKPQAIADFEYVSVPVAHRGLDPATAAATPLPDVATNIPSSHVSRLFAIVIDDLHLLPMDIVPAERVLTEFVNALTPDDQAAVVFVRRSDLGVNLTHDAGRLLAAFKHIKGSIDFGEDLPLGVLGKAGADQALQAARSTSYVLKNVAATLASSGYARRAILYVGTYSVLDPSAPLSGHGEKGDADVAQQYLDDAFTAARRADVPIYTLDPRGIPTPEKDSLRQPRTYQERAAMAHRIVVQQDHVAEIAVNTGGRFFINRPEITAAVDEMMAENGSFYLLGYYPDPFEADGKFHGIGVHVKRPGVNVRARAGYVASTAATTASNLNDDVQTALGSGVNLDALALTGFAAPVAIGEKGMTTAVTVEVTYPVAGLASHHIDDDVELSVMALDPDGKVEASSTHPWHFAGAAPAVDAVKFMMDDVIDLPSRALTLRLGVASKALGKVGTLQLPLEIPRPDGDVRLGGVVLGLTGDRHEPALGGAAIALLLPFQPVTARTFDAADTIRVFVPVFWNAKTATVTGTVALNGQGGGTPSQTVTAKVTRTAGDIAEGALDVSFPLSGLAHGGYVMTIDVAGPGGHHAMRQVPIAIK